MVQQGSWPCRKVLFVPSAKDEEGRRCVCCSKLVMTILRIITLCTVYI